VAQQLFPTRRASAAIFQAVTATNVSIWAVDYLIRRLRRYAPPHNGTIAPMPGLSANGFTRHSFATPFASYNMSGDRAKELLRPCGANLSGRRHDAEGKQRCEAFAARRRPTVSNKDLSLS
jgi:hypothetical protein